MNAEVVEEAEASDKRRPLTIRTIGEILEMSFDDEELILSERLSGPWRAHCDLRDGRSRQVDAS